MRPNVYLQTPAVTIWHGDSIEIMRELPDNSVDSIVTDPPYGLGFMGKAWDALPPGEEWATECLRVLKPGGHLLAFGGSRTWHRLAVAVEDAGFEIRDSIAWLYGSGFPKSLDVSKAIDKAAGAERTEVIGTRGLARWKEGAPGGAAMKDDGGIRQNFDKVNTLLAPATAAAEEWQGWGTALKPAFEPVVVARKPLTGTVTQNVLQHGTGALNIDACRIESDPATFGLGGGSKVGSGSGENQDPTNYRTNGKVSPMNPSGRWPANVALDEDMAQVLDGQSGVSKSSAHIRHNEDFEGVAKGAEKAHTTGGHTDSGGASRFFYVAKAPKRERPVVDGVAHPTVKPLALMQWLIRLVTPAGGVVLDPFEGSGTTLEACLIEGYRHIGIEREADYLPLIAARMDRQTDALPAAA